MSYHVYVENIGQVAEERLQADAKDQFEFWKQQSKAGRGRAAGETVTLVHGVEIIAEHHGFVATTAMLDEMSLEDALWWYIENMAGDASNHSSQVFFYLRARRNA